MRAIDALRQDTMSNRLVNYEGENLKHDLLDMVLARGEHLARRPFHLLRGALVGVHRIAEEHRGETLAPEPVLLDRVDNIRHVRALELRRARFDLNLVIRDLDSALARRLLGELLQIFLDGLAVRAL